MAWIFARCGITAGLLALLVWQLGLHSIIERLHTLTLGPLILVVLMLAVQLLLSAWRWKALVDYFGPVEVSTVDLCWFLGASHFYGEVMPSTIGGDVVRTAMLARLTGFGPASLSVILDRITGLAMLLVIMIALLPLLWWRIEQGRRLSSAWHCSVSAGLAALGALLLLRRQAMPVLASSCRRADTRDCSTFTPSSVESHSLGRKLSGMDCWCNCFLFRFFVLGRALGSLLSFLDCMLLVPPALLLSALPVSLSGWGVREGALAGGFALIGAPPADIVAISILYGLTSPAIGIVYAILSLLRR